MDPTLRASLQQLIEDERPASLIALADLVEPLRQANDEAALIDLFSLFRDGDEVEDKMWVLLHAVESLPFERYLDTLLDVLPELGSSAPDRAMWLVGRVHNSEPHWQVLEDRLTRSTGRTRILVGQLVDRWLKE